MKIGFSLSPGGLLLPYHQGVLESLQQNRVLTADSLVVGSSAGSIAAMSYGCGIPPRRVLEATIEISEYCDSTFGGKARGKLLPLLEKQMEQMVGDQEFDYLNRGNSEETNIGIVYTELFPSNRGILQTSFATKQELFHATRFSCMFPFFSTNWPVLVHKPNQDSFLPRLMVDGYFAVPRSQFGCPFLHEVKAEGVQGGSDTTMGKTYDDDDDEVESRAKSTTATTPIRPPPTYTKSLLASNSKYATSTRMDRTVAISCLPHDVLGMTAFASQDIISPNLTADDPNEFATFTNLFRIATQPSSRKELTRLYELGYQNAETWYRNEQQQCRNEDNTIVARIDFKGDNL